MLVPWQEEGFQLKWLQIYGEDQNHWLNEEMSGMLLRKKEAIIYARVGYKLVAVWVTGWRLTNWPPISVPWSPINDLTAKICQYD